ncbi:MAG: tetraacyldisaccharide 4'-kinase [Methylocystis sp.]|nr:tetraacyldisaccharide 4'-kinase [Methylocystis sp.]
MRAPDFWRRLPAGPAALVLAPLGSVYGAVAAARMARRGVRAGLPTICIGGFTAGGDGKTPAALAAAALLQGMGERPAFLTRGAGRRRRALVEPFVVDRARHGAQEAGDEALLLAHLAPTIVAADRVKGARSARDIGASVLLLDDGLQSRRLEFDFALAVVDAPYGVGNGLCLPAGPLRAPLPQQIAAIDAVLTIGQGPASEAIAHLARAAGKLSFSARAQPDARAAARIAGNKIFAFAGIARPAKFLATLREIGADVVGARWFADHHVFTAREIAALRQEAGRLGARLVATEKDAARIDASAAREAAIEVLPVELVVDDPARLATALVNALKRARLSRGA